MRGRGAAFLVGRAAGQNRAAQQNAQQPIQEDNQSDELEKLSKMHHDGDLSDEEFTKAKKKILSGK